jgi:hypothetical protein
MFNDWQYVLVQDRAARKQDLADRMAERQRDRPPALEEQKFGKEPIFARRPGQRPGGSSNG